MKNKYVDFQEMLDLGLDNIGNLEISGEVSVVPSTCSDYYFATKLSQKIGLPVKDKHDVVKDEKVFVCVSWMYECEITENEIIDGVTPIVGILLTSKTLDEAKKAFPLINITAVVDPSVYFLAGRESDPEALVRQIIDYVGEDPNRTGVVGTPERVVRMWNEIYGGYDPANKPKITTFYEPDSINSHDIIFDKGEAWSNCEHHMAPFKVEYCFAYIPNPKGKLLGLSKISRVVRYCSQKMQLQERIGTDVVNMIVEELTSGIGEQNPPLGVAIMLKGAHSCKTMRGVKTPGSMISTYTWGCFEKQCPERKEFMDTAREVLGKGQVIFG